MPMTRCFALGASMLLAMTLAACVSAPKKAALERPGLTLAHPVTTDAGDAMRLQSSLMALADTSVSRIVNEIRFDRPGIDGPTRRYLQTTRLALASALWSIATGPDPVDGLLDMLTNTTLTADAQRNYARSKPDDALQQKLVVALERNEADAWKLAEQWFDQATRSALRERILAAPVEREAPALVSYVRLSDLPRAGSATVDAGDGVIDSLRAANKQADQVRLLAERSLYLMQRMPYLMRWQGDGFATDALAMEDMQRLLKQVEALTKASTDASRTVAGLPATISREREAALEDLFAHISEEREAALRQVAEIVRVERAATLADISATVAKERKATIADLTDLAGEAEVRGSAWVGLALLVGVVLIALFLGGLFGTIVMYRRYAFRLEQQR